MLLCGILMGSLGSVSDRSLREHQVDKVSRRSRRRAARPARPMPAAARTAVEGSGTTAADPGEPMFCGRAEVDRYVTWLLPPLSPGIVPTVLTRPADALPYTNEPDGSYAQ